MTAVLEPTPESVTSLMLETFRDVHQLPDDVLQLEQLAENAYLQHREGVAAILRLGLTHYLSDKAETADVKIAEALNGRIVEAEVHAGMQGLEPFEQRSRRDREPRTIKTEVVRGTFAGVQSAKGRLQLRHQRRDITYGIQVVQSHRGLIRPVVDLAFPERPKLSLVMHNSRSHTYA